MRIKALLLSCWAAAKPPLSKIWAVARVPRKTWETIRLFRVAWRHLSTASPVVAWGMLAAALLSSMVSPATILLTQKVVDLVASRNQGASQAILWLVLVQATDGAVFSGFMLGGWDLFIQEKTYQKFFSFLVRHFAVGINADTALQVQGKLEDLKDEMGRGYWAMPGNFFATVESAGTLIGVLAIAAALPKWLLALVLARAGLAGYVNARFGWRAYHLKRRKDPARKVVFASYSTLTDEDSIYEVHHYKLRGTPHFLQFLEDSISSFLKLLKKISFQRGGWKFVSGLAGGVIMWRVYLYCATQPFSIGEFTRYTSAMMSFSSSLASFLSAAGALHNGAQTAEQISEFTEGRSRESRSEGSTTSIDEALPIDVQELHVEFRTSEEKERAEEVVPVLRGLNFKVDPGQKVAIIGPNGAGKTTLLEVLQGYHIPQITAGSVHIGGIDVREWQGAILRHRIAVCRQKVCIFPMTLGENIGFFDGQDVDTDLVRHVAELIGNLEELETIGLNTLLCKEAGGRPLSGGQAQKVQILRAFYHVLKGARLFIGDEATSNVDPRSAARIYSELLKLDCTVLLVCHSLLLARQVGQHPRGRIVVMNAGRIVEEGNHDQLVAQEEGYYHNLLKKEGLLDF